VIEDPVKLESRTCRWSEANSCDERPLTVSIVKKNPSLLPAEAALGIGDDDLVEETDPPPLRGGSSIFTILMSTRHDPIASEVYLQNIGTTDVEQSRLYIEESEIIALPMKEYSGGGQS
jgi:hypothetical protein